MRKVDLTVLEMNKYETIKRLIETDGNKLRAAVQLNLSIRQINRLIKVYKEKGKVGFSHGNKGKISSKAVSLETKNKIIDLYKTKYDGSNIKHYCELLNRNEGINYSYNFIYTLLRENYLLSPKVHKRTIKFEHKKIKLMNEKKEKLAEGQKDLIVKNNILAKYEAHSRIPRLKYFGECLEMDASKEYWFGNFKTTLHGAIDNATGAICGLYFDKEETLSGYYHLFERIWRKFGVPAKFKTDNRTVFIYGGLKEKTMDKDTLTQFGYACNVLGVDIETTSVPEQKSRIERLWGTLQNRLSTELRIAGINNIEDANEFVNSYIDEFNSQFALHIDYNTSVFIKVDESIINNTLSIISKRKFDKGCSIKYKNKIYCAYQYGHQMNYCRGTSCLVIETYDGQLLCNVDNKLSVLYELEQHQIISKEFDFKKEIQKPKKGSHIPKLTHPWKQESFLKYLATLPRHEAEAYI